jgi:hypothetical protein
VTAPFVDRIEGQVAVLVVDGRERRVPLKELPKGVREGVCLTADLKALDETSTEALRSEIAALRAKLKKDDGGDFSL